jgi:hypothetical protein
VKKDWKWKECHPKPIPEVLDPKLRTWICRIRHVLCGVADPDGCVFIGAKSYDRDKAWFSINFRFRNCSTVQYLSLHRHFAPPICYPLFLLCGIQTSKKSEAAGLGMTTGYWCKWCCVARRIRVRYFLRLRCPKL